MTKRALLCIDAGNTLVKWCVHADARQAFAPVTEAFSKPTAHFRPFLECAALLNEQLGIALSDRDLPVEAVLLCNVLGPEFEQAVRALCSPLNIPVHVLAVNANHEVQSLYENPATLGKDRWAACLAVSIQSNAPVNVLVGLGTATTLDALVKTHVWQHLGGFIVPGINTMLDSLHINTAELPRAQLSEPRVGHFWPVGTQQAISEGVVRMQLAMIESLASQLDREFGQAPAVWLSGGFASHMQGFLPRACLLEQAVFKGLVFDYQQLTRQGSV